jgi:hypothetical protein
MINGLRAENNDYILRLSHKDEEMRKFREYMQEVEKRKKAK